MRALVLGGSGFIGTHLVKRLLAEGHEVAVLDRVQPVDVPDLQIFQGSHEDPRLLARAVRGRDLVFHLISTTVPATSNQDMEYDIQSNLVSTLRLLDAMLEADVRRMVYLSSGGAVYGNPQYTPIDEHHPLLPISSYGVTKVAIENYLHMYQELHGLRPLVIRPSNAYGPGQSLAKPQGAIAHFLAQAIEGLPVKLWGDGTVRRDYLFVDDLIDLIVKAAASRWNGTFNAGAGIDHSLLQIVEAIEEVLGRRLEKEFLPARNCEVQQIRLDISLSTETFAWLPRVRLREGIARQHHAMQRADRGVSASVSSR